MARKTLDTITEVDNVTAGSTMTVRFPVGRFAYDRAKLELGGDLVKADLSDMFLKANSKPIQYWLNTTHFDAVRAYYGGDVIASELGWNFMPTWFNRSADAIRLALGCANLDSLTITAKISATPAAPEVKCVARAREYPMMDIGGKPVDINRLGLVVKVRHQTVDLIGDKTTPITGFDKQDGFLIGKHIFHGGNVTGAQLWIDRQNLWNCAEQEGGNTRMQSEVKEGGRTPQTNCHHIDMLLDNELGDEVPLAGVNDYRLLLDHSASDTAEIYSVYLGFVDGIPA